MNPGFLPSSEFSACVDLDGAEAARYLESKGVRVVGHTDLHTNGIAIGYLGDGRIAALSTNGHLSIYADREALSVGLPRAFAFLERIEAAGGDFPIA